MIADTSSNELYGHARVHSGDVGPLLAAAEQKEPPRLATEATPDNSFLDSD